MIQSLPKSSLPKSSWPRWLGMLGPAFAVSVGYVDPGNWATDLAAGAYRYQLLWVVLVAGAIAMVLQLGAARIALVTGEDLATLIAERWKSAAPLLGILFEAAIIATDLAEFAGIVVGIQLIFRVSMAIAVAAGLLAVAAIFLINAGRLRALQRWLIAMLSIVAASVLCQLWQMHPSARAIASGALLPRVPDHAAILVIVGLIGATVMPHNLFLHSALIKESCRDLPTVARRQRSWFYCGETVSALLIATLVNGAILVVGASFKGGEGSFALAFGLIRAHTGMAMAILFGAALTVSGLASSVTATMSNDYVLSAFVPIRTSPLMRRALAVVPAAAALSVGIDPLKMMLWSQALLAMILPAVVVPLIVIMATMKSTRVSSARRWTAAAATAGAICIAFDAALIVLMV
jgi:manganese transport protein